MIKTRRIGEWFEITVPVSWKGLTIDDVFRNIWKAPRKLIHMVRMEKGVMLDDRIPSWNKPLDEGKHLRLRVFREENFGVIPAFHAISILYEDDHFLIMNKPFGMNTHPNEPGQTDTLANAAAFHLDSKKEFRAIRHVHRLDRDTTGVILFSKHALAGAILDKMLEERQIKRTYVALTTGMMAPGKGRIDQPIGRDRHHPTRRRVSPTGQPAITHYEVMKILEKKKMTLVKCSLETGRTHQIRAHFSYLGYPLAGDRLYGGSSAFYRQALHAAKLELIHPFTGEKLSCSAPFIDDPPIFPDISVEKM